MIRKNGWVELVGGLENVEWWWCSKLLRFGWWWQWTHFVSLGSWFPPSIVWFIYHCELRCIQLTLFKWALPNVMNQAVWLRHACFCITKDSMGDGVHCIAQIAHDTRSICFPIFKACPVLVHFLTNWLVNNLCRAANSFFYFSPQWISCRINVQYDNVWYIYSWAQSKSAKLIMAEAQFLRLSWVHIWTQHLIWRMCPCGCRNPAWNSFSL